MKTKLVEMGTLAILGATIAFLGLGFLGNRESVFAAPVTNPANGHSY